MKAKTACAGREALSVAGGREVDLRGRKGEKCFVRRREPRVLILKVSRAWAWEICEGDFSGCRMPGMQKARWRWVLLKRVAQWEAAAEMVLSSFEGGVGMLVEEWWWGGL